MEQFILDLFNNMNIEEVIEICEKYDIELICENGKVSKVF